MRLQITVKKALVFGYVEEDAGALTQTECDIREKIVEFRELAARIRAEIAALPAEDRPTLRRIIQVDPARPTEAS